jgi:hypothetical protein
MKKIFLALGVLLLASFVSARENVSDVARITCIDSVGYIDVLDILIDVTHSDMEDAEEKNMGTCLLIGQHRQVFRDVSWQLRAYRRALLQDGQKDEARKMDSILYQSKSHSLTLEKFCLKSHEGYKDFEVLRDRMKIQQGFFWQVLASANAQITDEDFNCYRPY